jgi:hypothetical protein
MVEIRSPSPAAAGRGCRERPAQRALLDNLDARVAEIAARQHGVVGRQQLLDAGLSRSAVHRRLGDGRLVPLHRGVYAAAHTAVRPVAYRFAAVLACGPGAFLSHRSAGEAWELCVNHRSRHEVTASGGGRRITTVEVHRCRLHPDEVTVLDGVPITTAARTLLDLAAVLPPSRLEKAIERAELLGLIDLVAIDAVLRRAHHRRGVSALRAALRAFRPEPHFTRSELERIAISFVQEHDLPAPAVNCSVGGEELDLYWDDARVDLECDGWATHRTRTAYERDRARDRKLQAAGIRVIRVTAAQLRHERDEVAADLRTLLEPYSAASNPPEACSGGPPGPSSAGSTLPLWIGSR